MTPEDESERNMNQINPQGPQQPLLRPLTGQGLQPGIPGASGFQLPSAPAQGLRPPAALHSSDQLQLSLSGPIAATPSISLLMAKLVDLPIYTAYATPTEVVIRGRAFEAEASAP